MDASERTRSAVNPYLLKAQEGYNSAKKIVSTMIDETMNKTRSHVNNNFKELFFGCAAAATFYLAPKLFLVGAAAGAVYGRFIDKQKHPEAVTNQSAFASAVAGLVTTQLYISSARDIMVAPLVGGFIAGQTLNQFFDQAVNYFFPSRVG